MSGSAIRPAVADDADALGAMHVAAWCEAYSGLVPQDVLASLDPARRAAMWQGIIPAGRVLVAEQDGAIVGFLSWGPQRTPDLPFAAEVGALYVLRHAQRRGLGRRLMAAAARQMQRASFASASLWVLDGNAPARRFYEALGGRACAQAHQPREGWIAHETAYGWDNLTPLLAAAPDSPDQRA
jgi:ribosomal protein S18 acetylase RimI-like enzyme